MDLPPEMALIELMHSVDTTVKPESAEVPVFTAEDAKASLNPYPKPGTVDSRLDMSMESGMATGMTSEADMPEGLRSILDPDRTVGMDDEELPALDPDRTMAEADATLISGPDAGDTSIPDEEVPLGVEVKPGSKAPKSSKGSGGSGGSGSSIDQFSQRIKATESSLNIQQRSVSREFNPDGPQTLLPDYELKRKLGEGGMGEVWLAKQLSLNRDVALKQIRSDNLKRFNEKKREKAKQAFLAEAVVTGDLNHPNIVPVYDMGTDDAGNLLYSMKCVSGNSWDRLINSLSESDNVEILRKIADAIAFAHSHGIIHRDLKPANIMVGDYGEVLVMDWGTALPLAEASKHSGLSAPSGQAGTPAYMAPELAEGVVEKIGPHSDVYLLGAMLFEIVSGFPPHPLKNDTGGSLTTRELIQNAFANRIVHTEASGELLEIAMKAMKTAPRDRYPNVGKFIEALKNYQKHAESVMMVNQAKKDLDQAKKSGDYAMYARSIYGFENALSLWDANFDAKTRLMNARLDYAEAALKKENFDLGLSLVDSERPADKAMYRKLMAGQEERNKRVARLRTMRWTAAILLVAIFVGAGIAFGIITKKQQEVIKKSEELAKSNADLVIEKQAAVDARDDAQKAEALAQVARTDAEHARDDAVMARMDAEKARDDEEKAKNFAKAAEEKERSANTKLAATNKQLDSANNNLKETNDALASSKLEVEKQRDEANIQRDRAETAKNEAVAAKRDALKEWYTAQIQLAGRYVNEDNFDSARQVIAAIEAKQNQKGSEELAAMREAEFERLKEACSQSDAMLGMGPDQKKAPLTAVAVGTQLIAVTDDLRTLRIWKIDATQTPQTTIKTPGGATALAISPDDSSLIVGDQAGNLTLWDPKTGDRIGELPKHRGGVTHLFFLSPFELISTSRDKTVHYLDLNEWKLDKNTQAVELKGHSDGILSVAKVADSMGETKALITGDSNRGEILYWPYPLTDKTKGIKLITNAPTAFTALVAQVRKNDDQNFVLFAGGDDGSIRSFEYQFAKIESSDAKRGEALSERRLDRNAGSANDYHKSSVSNLLIDPSNPDHLISTSQDNTGRVWNIAKGALMDAGKDRGVGPEAKRGFLLNQLRGHGNAIIDAVAWKDPQLNATRLLTISSDGTARLWQPDTFPEIKMFGGEPLARKGGYGEVLSLSVGGKNKDRIIGVSTDGKATIWTIAADGDKSPTAAPITLREGHHFPTQTALFLEGHLLTTSFDGSAAIWDTTKRGAMQSRLPDVGSTGLLAGTNDGRWVITGYAPANSLDKNNIQIWSLPAATHQGLPAESRTLIAAGAASVHDDGKIVEDSPSIAAVSASGNWGIVGTENGYLSLIDLSAKPTLQKPVGAHVSGENPESRVPEGVTGVAFLSETEVASTGLDGSLRFWKIEDGNLVADLNRAPLKHEDGNVVHRIVGLTASADGKRVACRLRDGAPKAARHADFMQIWVSDVDETGAKTINKLQAWGPDVKKGDAVASVSLSPDGKKLLATVVLPADKTLNRSTKTAVAREWSFSTASEPAVTDVLKSVEGFDFQYATYLQGTSDEIAIISDTLTSLRKRSARGQFGDSPVAIYGPSSSLQACDVSQDGTMAVTVSDSVMPATDNGTTQTRLQGEIRVWNVAGTAGQRIGRLLVNGPVKTIAMSPTNPNSILVAGNLASPDNPNRFAAELYHWDGKELTLVQSLGHHRDGIIRASFSENGDRILTASSDGFVEMFQFDGSTYKEFRSLNLNSNDRKIPLRDLVAIDLNHDGSLIAAADTSRAIVIDATTGESILSEPLQGHSRDLTEIRFSMNAEEKTSNRIWTTSKDGTIKFWGIDRPTATQDGSENSARLLLTLRGHQRGVLALAALPNGGVVSAGEDGQVILWPVAQRN